MDADLALEGDQCHHNAVFDIAWMPYHLKLVSASGDHTAKLWDVTESKLIRIREFCGHTRSVKVATFRKNDCSVFATGGRDGAILVWDLRSSTNQDVIQKVDNRIYSAHVGGPTTPQSNRRRGARNTTPKLPPNVTNSSVTGLVFQDEHTLISCGPGDGIIKVWDLRRCYSTLKREPIAKHTLPYAGKSTFKGFTNLVVDDGCRKLYANCMDSNIYCYNISSYSKDPVMTYTGLQNNTFYIKSCISPDGNYLLSGSSDEKAYIWNLKNPQPMVALTGHNFEVTCVAWSQHQNNLDGGNMCVVTCSDDACHKIWRIGPDELQEDEKLLLRGKAELHKDYYSYYFGTSKKLPIKSQFKMLESTPRSLKRLIELSETTPTTAAHGSTLNTISVSQAPLSSSRKRSFSEMIVEAEEMEAGGSDVKRPNIETRGRRLFSPCVSANVEQEMTCLDGASKSLTTILEELDSPGNKNGHGSKNFQNLSPSPVKRQLNIIRSPDTLPKPCVFASPSIPRNRQPPMVNSPTTNLPNFVVDGEAPHLGLMSPQRKQKKENVDWLTKIRKQRLLTMDIPALIVGIKTEESSSSSHDTNDIEPWKNNDDKTENPNLKAQEELKTEVQVAGGSTKKKNETTILNFFAVKSTKTQSTTAGINTQSDIM